ncbi:hypothetical protein ABTY98_37100 [Streptomyces sp. NPDC096040]|uniref:hypothetical protein n=1 Tax=Streptomyces sp. NPDC096040 TaxID=3155541 RepID=UPI00331BABF1
MASFEFEVEPELDGPVRRGYAGVVGPFGAVRVFRPQDGSGAEPLRQVILSGAEFPAAVFRGGVGNLPSLDGGMLKIGDVAVDMDLKVAGIRKGSRWLEIHHQGCRYRYTSAGGAAHLERDGAKVTMGRGRYIRGVGGTRQGKAEGDVTATDLAIALVLEEVDKTVLTTGGALLAIPMNFLFGRQRDEGTW